MSPGPALRWPDYADERIGKLPRSWPFWRDAAFWGVMPVSLLPGGLGAWFVLHYQPQINFDWLTACALLFALAYPASLLWLLRDTWRWDHPERYLQLAYGIAGGFLYLPIYIYAMRGEWLMHVANEQRNH